ncbi:MULTISPECIES: LysR family transcriptional regulator [Actinoplanes]|uniref:LysR family transcriptional regulator n=1 Tax=Actinoplanes TaxID=1865 RepID=UPI0005F2E9E6|nr:MULTISPECIES: LysR family transcriptional regulator [Actinoplanes]GLY00263.1 LysR family transcriptional regulator [Actinoplanes sp. NBRC 101535]
MIDPRRLQILAEVARQGSFNRAAARLRLTPSAVSQQISALEQSLGTAVFVRSTRGVTLTPAGQVLADTATAVAAELLAAERELTRLADGSRTLTVVTFTTGGQRLLPPALIRFNAAHPGVELTVIESEPAASLPLIRSGEADLALVYHLDDRPPVPPGLTWTPLMDDPMWIVLPAGHPLGGRGSLSIAELGDERWVHGCLVVGDLVEQYATAAGLTLRTACRGTDYHFAQQLVRAGVGISMIPEVALTADQTGLTAVRLEPPGPCRYVAAVTARRAGRSPLVGALLEELRCTVTALPPAPAATRA